MTCRTPTGPQVCTSSSQTGASLTSDAEGRLIRWVSADGSTTVNYGYDGEGHRFAGGTPLIALIDKLPLRQHMTQG